jgi:hypothetical protein
MLLPTDDQMKAWFVGLKRYIMPLVFLLFPVLLSIGAEHRYGDWSQIRVVLMFLSVLAGAAWAFFMLLSDKEGKGLLPDFHLLPYLEKAKEDPLASSIVAVGFFGTLCTFLVVVAGLMSPR